MQPELGDLTAPVLAMLAGGLLSSLGLGWMARRPRGRALLAATRGWSLAAGAAVAVLAGGGAVLWLVRSLLDAARQGEAALPAAPTLLLFGFLVGLPLALPAVVITWTDARRARSKRRDRVATKDDRRAYAQDLVRQIAEASDRPRELRASVEGDGARVLRLDGDLDAREAGRLVAALRADLKDLGFKRVEGGAGGGSWWEPV